MVMYKRSHRYCDYHMPHRASKTHEERIQYKVSWSLIPVQHSYCEYDSLKPSDCWPVSYVENSTDNFLDSLVRLAFETSFPPAFVSVAAAIIYACTWKTNFAWNVSCFAWIICHYRTKETDILCWPGLPLSCRFTSA